MLNDWINNFYNENYYNSIEVCENEPQVIHNIITTINTGRKVIDFGCGFGNIIQELNELGYQTTGVDASEFSIKKCLNKNLNVIHGNFSEVIIPEKFNIALSWNTCIGHISIENDIKFFNNVYNHLDDNGVFILMVAHSEYIINNFKETIVVNNIERKSILEENILIQSWIMNNETYLTKRILYTVEELENMLAKFSIDIYGYLNGNIVPYNKDAQKILLVCKK